jgi:hypothetical protein
MKCYKNLIISLCFLWIFYSTITAQEVGHVSEKSKIDDVGELHLSKTGMTFERRITSGITDDAVMVDGSATVAGDFVTGWVPGFGSSQPGANWQPGGYGGQKSIVFREIQSPDGAAKKYYRPIFRGTAEFHGQGNGPKRKYGWTVNARYEVTTAKIKIELEAELDFESRSLHKFGLLEKGTVKVLPFDEADRDALFPLKNLKSSEPTDFKLKSIDLNNGTAKFQAGTKKSGEIRITAIAKNNEQVIYSVSVTPPTSVRLVWERNMVFPDNLRAAGFLARVFLEPKDVSFRNIAVGEDTCVTLENRRNKIDMDPKEHPSWVSQKIEDEHIQTGCRVYGPGSEFDQISVFTNDMSDNTAKVEWKIPWVYFVNNEKHQIGTQEMVQTMELQKNRKAKVKKFGIIVERQAPQP